MLRSPQGVVVFFFLFEEEEEEEEDGKIDRKELIQIRNDCSSCM